MLVAAVYAQDAKSGRGKATPEAESPEPTVIKRLPLTIEDPRSYEVPIRLQAVRALTLIAPTDGIVLSVEVKPGEAIPAQANVARMDARRAELLMRQADANVNARRIELSIAESAGGAQEKIRLAEAHLEAAKAALELAAFDLEKMTIRGPFEGTILKVHVVAGQFVRAGDPVAELADLTSLVAEIPVDRDKVKAEDKINVTIETEEVPVVVEAVLPPSKSFEKLRPLTDSLATARVLIDNGRLTRQPGQAVYVDLIPKQPVAVVPTMAVSNADNGQRKVQVVREMTIREVPIEPLAQIGSERLYVSGEFSAGDEVIVSSSTELSDGAMLRPWIEAVDNPAMRPSDDSSSEEKKDRGVRGL